MQQITQAINGRRILYCDIREDLQKIASFQLANWVVLVIADSKIDLLDQFSDFCIDHDVLYMCATGQICSEVDDLFDMNMVMRKIKGHRLPSWYTSEEDVLMTSWHHVPEEGFWFVTTLATYEDHPIDTLVVANFTDRSWLLWVEQLTQKINSGWLPSDDLPN